MKLEFVSLLKFDKFLFLNLKMNGYTLWVLSAKGIYLVSGWVITPWGQTLQSLGTTHRCKPPRDPMSLACIRIIEFSVNCIFVYIYMPMCVMLVNRVKFSYEYFLVYISLPFFCVSVLFVFLWRWSPIRWL